MFVTFNFRRPQRRFTANPRKRGFVIPNPVLVTRMSNTITKLFAVLTRLGAALAPQKPMFDLMIASFSQFL